MPWYRFHIETHLSPQAALARVSTLVRERPGLVQSFKEAFGWRPDGAPPFFGSVEGTEFKCQRDIRYKNSFLPRIRGRVGRSPYGTRIDVTMSLHPIVAALMVIWLGGVGISAVVFGQSDGAPIAMMPIPMFIFGVGLTLGAFYPEAIKARRLLEQHLSDGIG